MHELFLLATAAVKGVQCKSSFVRVLSSHTLPASFGLCACARMFRYVCIHSARVVAYPPPLRFFFAVSPTTVKENRNENTVHRICAVGCQ